MPLHTRLICDLIVAVRSEHLSARCLQPPHQETSVLEFTTRVFHSYFSFANLASGGQKTIKMGAGAF